MENFTKNQQEMREKFTEALAGKLTFKDFEQMTRQNVQMFERAMRMFSPFGAGMGWNNEGANPFAAGFGAKPNGAPEASSSTASGGGASPQRDAEIRDLKDQIAAMRQQIADLAQRK